ncbi:L-proline trans-4-hydroxylase-like isoform X2 [Mercenaria mercenaria]|uniref:L-proline trans-4-hydroxylase-like isoform X2 n=1 Tax=Mercenaria mercenaria TaxID=6596 RepID=UPI001E1DF99E|nr:L-proline trans-4-hydroxylase-like isoform X2 [Mercenaria mercenaria]
MPKEGFGPHGNEFKYEDPEFRVTDEVRRAFDDNGFIIVRGLMDSVETGKIKKSLEEYGLVEKYSYGLPDAEGREPRMMLWSYCGNDVLGLVPRCEKVVSTCEKLMGGDELYHYHTKIMMKDPKKGGSFEWHQDYGYWYKNGVLKPDLLSMFLAVDPCVKENGGLQVLVGSHKAGRIDHTFDGGQQGAEKERVEHLKKVYEHFQVNLQPGDAILFHSNLLHSSGPNDSEQRRWAFNCSYNKKSNNPVKKHHHPCYNKLTKVSNNAIKECENYCEPEGKEFVDPATDETVKAGSKPSQEQ